MVCGICCTLGNAQDKKVIPPSEEGEVVRVNTELIDVPVVVTDRAGKPILNLKQPNFRVFEDGKPQEVLEFSTTAAPFEVALLLDTSGSTRADLALIQRSAQYFIDSLRPGDRVAIIAYKTGYQRERATALVDVVSELTDDRTRLKAALDKVGTSNGTPYYDSLVEIAQNIFGKEPTPEFRGRRALVALTDGVDSTSVSEFDEGREYLEKVGVMTFFIQVDTRQFFEESLLGDCETATRLSQSQMRRYYRQFKSANIEKASSFCQLGEFERLSISKNLYETANAEMNALAKTSGGRVFPTADLNEARAAFRSVAAEIGTKYSLAYYSSNEKRDGTFRKIRVELKGLPAGSQVRAREGYTAPAN
jgi:Ca-activated chloride channel family protein